ncbi:MAG: 4Fe-4S binding protein [Candidatus Geothermarchaeales archaeon]
MNRLFVADVDRCVGCQLCMFACSRRFGHGGLAKSAVGVRSAGGFERGFVVVVCRACKTPPCAKVCPTEALKLREGGGVKLVHDRCIGCRMCFEVCPIRAVFWDVELNKPNICIHCGYCANYCPHEVLTVKEVEGSG